MLNRPGDEKAPADYEDVLKQGAALDGKLEDLMESVYNTKVQRAVDEDEIHYLSRLHAQASSAERMVNEPYDAAPRPVETEELARVHAGVASALETFSSLVETDVAAYNETATKRGMPALFVNDGHAKQSS
jgi:hypothetical protein